ncbi:aryl-sulfate sulfotransferase [Cetobacterium sp.]|uniref:aryl-sulfate sulfotransferase n=1 Tax=Cetobacterium sp. TaxID=2071632 RepID=UPI003F67AE3B
MYKKIKLLFLFVIIIIGLVYGFEIYNMNNIKVNFIENPEKIVPMSGILEVKSKKDLKLRIVIEKVGTKEKKITEYNLKDQLTNINLTGFFSGENILKIEYVGLLDKIIFEKKLNFKLPNHLPEIRIELKNSENKYYLIDYVNQQEGKWIPFIIDSNGNIRWYLDFQSRNTGKLMESTEKIKNGNLISLTEHSILEYDMIGKIKNEYIFKNYKFHHDWVQLDNGDFLILATNIEQEKSFGNYRYDTLLEIDSFGQVKQEIDLKDILDKERIDFNFDKDKNIGLLGRQNWLHANSIDVNEKNIIISGRHQGIIILDLKTKKLKGIVAPHKGWREEYLNFLYTPLNKNNIFLKETIKLGLEKDEDSKFDWTWGQHQVTYTDFNKIIVFDNGDKRNFKENTLNSYSRVVEYELDDEKRNIKQIKEIILEPKNLYYSWFMSGVEKKNNNYLITFGTINNGNLSNPYLIEKTKIVELNSDEEKIFEVELKYKELEKGMKGAYRTTSFEF